MELHTNIKTPLDIRVHEEDERGNIITFVSAILTSWWDGKKTRYIYIPAWFQSDGFSVPRFLWWLISPKIDQRTLRGAGSHDLIYRTQPEGWTRKDADLMMYDFIRQDGMNWVSANLAYQGVRRFGWIPWNKSKKELEEK